MNIQPTDTTKSARDTSLAARAAWLHFVGGLTQSEVARLLNVPTTRAHRYIARAQSEGLVRVFVDVEAADCMVLERKLVETYGLSMCRVAMDVPDSGPLPLRTLGAVGSDYIMQVIASDDYRTIGIGHGRTLAAAVAAIPRVSAGNVRFVSVLGGLTRTGAANPYDVIHILAARTGAEAYLMPAPLFADTAEGRAVMMRQGALSVTMGLIAEASLVIVGIGNLSPSGGGTPATALHGVEEAASLYAAGARAEILGQFLDADGVPLATPYDDRVMAPPLETLRGREVVAIAGGTSKVEAIRTALQSGLLTGLIIDEATARALVDKDGLLRSAANKNDEHIEEETTCTKRKKT